MDFTKPWKQGDITFIVEDEKIYANKTVLFMSSDVFCAMFDSDFSEKNRKEINLPDKTLSDFVELMGVLHPPLPKAIDANNAYQLFPLAHEYQIGSMIQQCKQIMLGQPVTLKHLILADKFCIPELRDKCMVYINNTQYVSLQQDPHFKELDEDMKVGLQITKEPASVHNYLLAEQHRENFKDAYEKCLQYLKDTPLSELKEADGFGDVDKGVLFEVLTTKVERLEKFTSLIQGIVDTPKPCPSTTQFDNLVGGNTGSLYHPSAFGGYNNPQIQHDLGTQDNTCSACSSHSAITGQILVLLNQK